MGSDEATATCLGRWSSRCRRWRRYASLSRPAYQRLYDLGLPPCAPTVLSFDHCNRWRMSSRVLWLRGRRSRRNAACERPLFGFHRQRAEGAEAKLAISANPRPGISKRSRAEVSGGNPTPLAGRARM